MHYLLSLWSPYGEMVSLLLAAWITYLDLLHGAGGVSDDNYGILLYRGDWKDPDPNKPPEQWIKGPIGFGRIWRQVRWLVGRVENPNKNWKRDNQPQWVHNLNRHHRLNIWLLCGVAGLLYGFLSRVCDSNTAFLATLLFIVHPLGTQTIAWISGNGYALGMIFMLIGSNLIFIFQDAGWMSHPLGVVGAVLIYALCQWLAVEAMFASMGIVWVLLYLHLWPFAVVAGLFTALSAISTFKTAINLRRAVFKEQMMEQSTKFYPRKLVVVLKSLAYYTKLVFFPKRMGLYHQYCYHYEMPYVEAEDGFFYVGVLLILLMGWGMWLGPPVVQLACVWYLAFLVIFLNWITANQFFTERYAWIPTVGACLLVAAYAPAWLYWTLLGIALMRTWGHLPTYYNETQFYESNLWNFPTSEIASGNLGVTMMHRGLIGSANEAWIMGIRMNPEYDVNWYNLASAFKTRGLVNPNYIPIMATVLPPQLQQLVANDPMKGYLVLSKYCLEMALKSRTCHFPKQWAQELDELNKAMEKLAQPQTTPVAVPVVQSSPALVVTEVKNVA